MKTEIVNITPDVARQFLAANIGNRPLRRSLVLRLKDSFARGEYVPTHQGIAFSVEGILMDGQHRLQAISEMKDVSFPMLVSRGLPPNAFMTMDIGVVRNDADALQIKDKKLVECARLATKLCGIRTSPASLLPVIAQIQESHDAVMKACSTTLKVMSSAPVRLAAVVSIMSGENQEHVLKTYRALVLNIPQDMTEIAASFARQVFNGKVHSVERPELYTRALGVFTENKKGLKHSRLSDVSGAIENLRGFLAKRA